VKIFASACFRIWLISGLKKLATYPHFPHKNHRHFSEIPHTATNQQAVNGCARRSTRSAAAVGGDSTVRNRLLVKVAFYTVPVVFDSDSGNISLIKIAG